MKEKCNECGNTSFFDAFLADENGQMYYVKGKCSLKNQFMGKRKKLKARICDKCGSAKVFAELK